MTMPTSKKDDARYSVEEYLLTPSTVVYRVKRGSTVVAQSVKKVNAEHLANFMTREKIMTMADWKRQSWSVRRDYIVAFSDLAPNLTDAKAAH